MNNDKIHIDLKGDRLLLGAHFHELADHAAVTFKTAQIPDFVEFMKSTEGAEVLISAQGLEGIARKKDRYTQPMAECTLAETPGLIAMRSLIAGPKTLQEMVEFMEIHKRYATADTLAFLASLRHFKMKKVIGVEVQQERNGNYHCAVSLENAGKDDFEPPATLVWEVPVYRHLLDQADTLRLSFDLNFKVTQANPPVLHFVLTNHALDEEVLGKQKEILERHLKPLDLPKLWGSVLTTEQDDAWRFLQNPHPEGEGAVQAQREIAKRISQ